MKYCNGCKKDKYLSDFGNHSKRKDGKQVRCKECRNTYQKSWYKSDSTIQKTRVKEGRNSLKKLGRALVYTYLQNHPCVDCGESDLRVLEFDHRNPKDKYKNISYLLGQGRSLEILKKEIVKCDVRCANCHRKKTANSYNWIRLDYMSVDARRGMDS